MLASLVTFDATRLLQLAPTQRRRGCCATPTCSRLKLGPPRMLGCCVLLFLVCTVVLQLRNIEGKTKRVAILTPEQRSQWTRRGTFARRMAVFRRPCNIAARFVRRSVVLLQAYPPMEAASELKHCRAIVDLRNQKRDKHTYIYSVYCIYIYMDFYIWISFSFGRPHYVTH